MIAIPVITSPETVTFTVNPVPLPVKATVGTAVVLENAYPSPPVAIPSAVTGAP